MEVLITSEYIIYDGTRHYKGSVIKVDTETGRKLIKMGLATENVKPVTNEHIATEELKPVTKKAVRKTTNK